MQKIRLFGGFSMFMPLNYERKSPSEYADTPSGKVYSVGCDRRCKLIFVRSERFFLDTHMRSFYMSSFLQAPFIPK